MTRSKITDIGIESASAPSNPSTGQVWKDTSENAYKHYNGSEWVLMSQYVDGGSFSATGGEINDYTVSSTNYRSHTFLASGKFIVNNDSKAMDILVVAGGGGGGGAYQSPGGGGGGAGGMVVLTNQTIAPGEYQVIVGQGGVGGYGDGSFIRRLPRNGGNSQFGNLTMALGGGHGGNYSNIDAGDGGSGGGEAHGGGTAVGTSGQGSNGGFLP